MNKAIIVPLVLVLSLTIFGITINAGESSNPDRNYVTEAWNGSGSIGSNVSDSDVVNGSELTYDTGSAPMEINLLLSGSVVGVLVVTIALATVIGIQFMGSGLSTVTIMTIVKLGFFITLWGICGSGAPSLLTKIPWFGLPLYFLLTLIYSVYAVGEIQ